ncbi:hypothetical protein L484_016850 [Morus notabilis]|uniref:Oxysterol-binding protein-related protein 4B n=1 Tax=Morus notabilis TaxID=981085 RepID=W9QEQ2_9ROSA|nr:hypothetical protein L484_016850 [Morus notabilis]
MCAGTFVEVAAHGKKQLKLLNHGETYLLFGLRGSPISVKGKIYVSSSLKCSFKIEGHWDKIVTLKDLTNGEVKVIYNAKEVIAELRTPIVKDPKGVWPSESALVWAEVSQGILNKDWGKAREAKKAVEENQRQLLRDRKSRNETWVPKHFIVSYNKDMNT